MSDDKIIFYTKALRFEREFVWPLVGPVTMQQVVVSATVFVVMTILFLLFPSIDLKLAPTLGFVFAITVWFLYGAIKPDGKRIHRYVITVVSFLLSHKKKNMGQNVRPIRSKINIWVRVQD